ncbi:hypothetical protein CBL_03460 [Carabus blaptoides fortunei]
MQPDNVTQTATEHVRVMTITAEDKVGQCNQDNGIKGGNLHWVSKTPYLMLVYVCVCLVRVIYWSLLCMEEPLMLITNCYLQIPGVRDGDICETPKGHMCRSRPKGFRDGRSVNRTMEHRRVLGFINGPPLVPFLSRHTELNGRATFESEPVKYTTTGLIKSVLLG